MKYEDIKPPSISAIKYILTDVDCPKCKAKLLKDISVTYASNPPKFKYICPKCKFTGYNF